MTSLLGFAASPSVPSGTDVFSTLPIWGGGFVIGITQDALGTTQTAHNDTFGGYVKRPGDTKWQQLYTHSLLGGLTTDGTYPATFDGNGFYTLAVAPSDPTKGYGVCFGKIIAFSGNWTSASVCSMSAKMAHANGGPRRLWNDKIAISPTNPLVAVIGFEGTDGVYATSNGFASAPTLITGIATPTNTVDDVPAPILVSVDPNNDQRWAIFSRGTGCYLSTTGPTGTYTLLNSANMPTTCTHMMFDSAGTLWIADGVSSVVKYSSGAWAVQSTAPGNWSTIAVNPSDTRLVTIATPDGFISGTAVDGSWIPDRMTANYPSNNSYTATDAPWLGGSPAALFPSKILADVTAPSHILVAHGTGTCWANTTGFHTGFAQLAYIDTTPGITQLVPNSGACFDDGLFLIPCWDKGWFQMSDLTTCPSVRHPTDVYFTAAWGMDIDGDNAVVLADWNSRDLRITTNHAASWSAMADHPDVYSLSGSIAIQGSNYIVWLPANNGRGVTSIDGGASWQLLDLGGLLPAAGNETGFSFAYYFSKRNVCASKQTAGLWWIWNYGPSAIPSLQGLWRSTTGPAGPYTRIFHGSPVDDGAGAGAASWQYHCDLMEVPGHAGYLLFKAGGDQNVPLCSSTDGGVHWEQVTTTYGGGTYPIMNCASYGFGRAAMGMSYPAIRYYGIVNGTQGLFETLDNFATSRLVTVIFDNSGDNFKTLTGDPSTFGKWIYGMDGSGWKWSHQ